MWSRVQDIHTLYLPTVLTYSAVQCIHGPDRYSHGAGSRLSCEKIGDVSCRIPEYSQGNFRVEYIPTYACM